MTIFDHLQNICWDKKSWNELSEDEQKTANMYMLHRFISMHYPYIEIVNEIQSLNLPPKIIYEIYRSVLPKQKQYFRYIKKTKKETKSEPIELIRKIFEVSEQEAKDYVELLDKKQLKKLEEQVTGKK